MRDSGDDLAVVGSDSLGEARAFAANHGVRRARGSFEEVLEADDVDAVYLALPHDLHERWATAALAAGKHVLCARPLSTDAASAGRMAAASARAGRVLMEALPFWFHPRTTAALDLIRDGELGEVRSIRADVGYRLREPHSHLVVPERGGGALLGVGSACVPFARWLAGAEPEAVRALPRRWSSGVDGAMAALLRFPSGAMATLMASFDTAAHAVVEVAGTDGLLRLPDALAATREEEAVLERDGEVIGSWRFDAYAALLEAFTSAASGGALPLSIDDAVASAEVLDRIRTAALTG